MYMYPAPGLPSFISPDQKKKRSSFSPHIHWAGLLITVFPPSIGNLVVGLLGTRQSKWFISLINTGSSGFTRGAVLRVVCAAYAPPFPGEICLKTLLRRPPRMPSACFGALCDVMIRLDTLISYCLRRERFSFARPGCRSTQRVDENSMGMSYLLCRTAGCTFHVSMAFAISGKFSFHSFLFMNYKSDVKSGDEEMVKKNHRVRHLWKWHNLLRVLVDAMRGQGTQKRSRVTTPPRPPPDLPQSLALSTLDGT